MGCRHWLFGILYVLAVAQAAAPQAQKKPSPKPNVILITIDTTRADRMGFLGSKRGLTPNLDDVAKQGTAFSRAFAHVPLTTPSHATILTGTYPQFNHVNDFGAPLAADLPDLPDLMRQQGYQTAAFVGSFVLDPVTGAAPGFERGFDVYDAGFRLLKPGVSRYETVERRAGDVVARALTWFAKRSKTSPFFLWVHLYDPHDPYDAPEPYKSKFSDPYDGEIAYSDAILGKLFSALKTEGVYDQSLIAVMADHGEAFGEHGEFTHGIFLYDETLHVPLLIKLPVSPAAQTGIQPKGKTEQKTGQKTEPKVDSRVSLIDVAPTILESVGLPVPEQVQGASLLPLMRPAEGAPPAVDRPAYAENDYPHRSFHWSSLRALRTGKYLYIEVPKRELYDQNSDPSSNRNLAESSPAIADTLNSQLETFRKNTASNATAGPIKLDPKQTANLSALGYVASEMNAATEGKIEGADPKDRIEIANSFHNGLLDIEESRFREAVTELDRVVQVEPASVLANQGLAAALIHLKDYHRALPVLQKALALRQDSGILQYRLGLALFETGSVQDSVPHFERAVQIIPNWVDAMYSLATVYLRTDREEEGLRELDKTLEVDPNYYRANLLRGALFVEDKPSQALADLEKAAQEQPAASEPHQYMGLAYEHLGNSAKAAQERSIAEKLKSH